MQNIRFPPRKKTEYHLFRAIFMAIFLADGYLFFFIFSFLDFHGVGGMEYQIITRQCSLVIRACIVLYTIFYQCVVMTKPQVFITFHVGASYKYDFYWEDLIRSDQEE